MAECINGCVHFKLVDDASRDQQLLLYKYKLVAATLSSKDVHHKTGLVSKATSPEARALLQDWEMAYIAEPDSAHYMASVVLSGVKPKVVFFESFQVTAAEDGLKYLAFKVLPQAGKDGGACIPADAIIDPHEMFGWSQDLLLEKYLEAATGLGIDITKSTSVIPLRMASTRLTMLKLASFMPHAASLVLQGLRDKDMAVYAQGQMQLDRLEREMRKLHRFHQELQREHDIVSRHREDSMACWLATLEPRMSPATPSHEGLTSDPEQQLQSKDVTP